MTEIVIIFPGKFENDFTTKNTWNCKLKIEHVVHVFFTQQNQENGYIVLYGRNNLFRE